MCIQTDRQPDRHRERSGKREIQINTHTHTRTCYFFFLSGCFNNRLEPFIAKELSSLKTLAGDSNQGGKRVPCMRVRVHACVCRSASIIASLPTNVPPPCFVLLLMCRHRSDALGHSILNTESASALPLFVTPLCHHGADTDTDTDAQTDRQTDTHTHNQKTSRFVIWLSCCGQFFRSGVATAPLRPSTFHSAIALQALTTSFSSCLGSVSSRGWPKLAR